MTETHAQPDTRRWKFGFRRWLVVALIVIEVIVAGIYAPIKPAVELAAESITPVVNLPILGNFSLTNTILTVLIADLLLILAALSVRRAFASPNAIPRGVAGVFEMIVEALHNLVQSVAGNRWVGMVFPLVATILILVLTVNFMKLLPGMESIGWLHEVHEGDGYAAIAIAPGIYRLGEAVEKGEAITPGATDTHSSEGDANVEEEGSHAEEASHGYNVIPWFRPSSTDVNFTLSIALLAMISVQIIGFRAGGFFYIEKFVNIRNFLKMWVTEKLGAFDLLMPFIDIFVGILELIAEIARIISFTFRLFGSMFAGAILLGVTGALFMVLQTPFLFLEIFFGGVQAFVFAMLTLVFMTMATQSHGAHAEGEEHHG